jgi:NAD(P)-dependent dehydrogenase (short-subunit alcohol dehydrogenase family)
MPDHAPQGLLRAGVLEGRSMLHARADASEATRGSPGALVGSRCAELGASVWSLEAAWDGSPESLEAAALEAFEHVPTLGDGIDLLVVDAASLFAAGAAAGGATLGDASRGALRACLEQTWNVTRTVLTRGLLPRGAGGRIVYVAPADDGGAHVEAARGGLENLARTLSVEWARLAITVVTVAPGDATTPGEVAELTAYLASRAGAYFSGCVLELGGSG